MCMGFASMYVYMHATCMPVAHGGQKKALGPWNWNYRCLEPLWRCWELDSVFCKISQSFKLLNHLSSPIFLVFLSQGLLLADASGTPLSLPPQCWDFSEHHTEFFDLTPFLFYFKDRLGTHLLPPVRRGVEDRRISLGTSEMDIWRTYFRQLKTIPRGNEWVSLHHLRFSFAFLWGIHLILWLGILVYFKWLYLN